MMHKQSAKYRFKPGTHIIWQCKKPPNFWRKIWCLLTKNYKIIHVVENAMEKFKEGKE